MELLLFVHVCVSTPSLGFYLSYSHPNRTMTPEDRHRLKMQNWEWNSQNCPMGLRGPLGVVGSRKRKTRRSARGGKKRRSEGNGSPSRPTAPPAPIFGTGTTAVPPGFLRNPSHNPVVRDLSAPDPSRPQPRGREVTIATTCSRPGGANPPAPNNHARPELPAWLLMVPPPCPPGPAPMEVEPEWGTGARERGDGRRVGGEREMEEGRGAGGERSGEGQARNRRIPFRNKGRGKGFRAHCRPVPRLEGLPPRVAKLVHDLEEDNKFLTRQIVHLQHKVIALQQGAPSAAATSTGRSRRCQGQQTDPGTPEGLGEPQQPSQPSPPSSAVLGDGDSPPARGAIRGSRDGGRFCESATCLCLLP